MSLRRAVVAIAAALAASLCIGGCAGDESSDAADRPSLREMRAFRAYPVYYAGPSVAGNPLLEIFGDPKQQQDKRDTTWILIYGDCDAESGGCFPPVQIHSYSTCARWARPGVNLFDVRGAKATREMRGAGAGIEIFTGRTTVTIGAESGRLLNSTMQALREVHQKKPSRLLPPPAPGSLRGELPCQTKDGR